MPEKYRFGGLFKSILSLPLLQLFALHKLLYFLLEYNSFVLISNFSPSSQWFVFVGVVSFLYCIMSLGYYVFMGKNLLQFPSIVFPEYITFSIRAEYDCWWQASNVEFGGFGDFCGQHLFLVVRRLESCLGKGATCWIHYTYGTRYNFTYYRTSKLFMLEIAPQSTGIYIHGNSLWGTKMPWKYPKSGDFHFN